MSLLEVKDDLAEGKGFRYVMTKGEDLQLPLRLHLRAPGSTCRTPIKAGPAAFDVGTSFYCEAKVSGTGQDLLVAVVEFSLGSDAGGARLELRANGDDISERCFAEGAFGEFTLTLFVNRLGIETAVAEGTVTVRDNGSVG